jgi:hypothetical protein
MNLNEIKTKVYDPCGLQVSNFQTEDESKEYGACRFEINGLKIVSRNAKVTPKKVGQFVTFWKRNQDGITEPIHASDDFDFYTITAKTETQFGQFVFPKSVLIAKGIVSTDKKDGKRGFRIYPAWDITKNKQAEKTQKWQLYYFYEIGESLDLKRINELYK